MVREFVVKDIDKDKMTELIRLGIDNLPTNSNRPDNELAGYFYRLSEIEGLSAEMRDLLADAFVYCKNGSDFPVPSDLSGIKNRYKELSE